MSASGGTRAIIAAFLANTGIALTKFIAWFFSGSASMLAEGVHSVADAGNQLLLILGGRQAKKTADKEHPFGYGRERYVYAFVVSIILFSVGGIFSIYEGVDKLHAPARARERVAAAARALDRDRARVVLAAHRREGVEPRARQAELGAVRAPREGARAARRAARGHRRPHRPRASRSSPSASPCITGNPLFDAIGTLMIGTLLIVVAIVLGIETKSLLVGEGANDDDLEKIEQAIVAGPEAERIIHMKTLYLGPDELLVAAKLGFTADQKLLEVAAATNVIEQRIRAAVPSARVIYIEPDVYVEPNQSAPPTDAIVIKGLE